MNEMELQKTSGAAMPAPSPRLILGTMMVERLAADQPSSGPGILSEQSAQRSVAGRTPGPSENDAYRQWHFLSANWSMGRTVGAKIGREHARRSTCPRDHEAYGP